MQIPDLEKASYEEFNCSAIAMWDKPFPKIFPNFVGDNSIVFRDRLSSLNHAIPHEKPKRERPIYFCRYIKSLEKKLNVIGHLEILLCFIVIGSESRLNKIINHISC